MYSLLQSQCWGGFVLRRVNFLGSEWYFRILEGNNPLVPRKVENSRHACRNIEIEKQKEKKRKKAVL
jgi:hypothetical protein